VTKADPQERGLCLFRCSIPHSGRPIGDKPVKSFMVICSGENNRSSLGSWCWITGKNNVNHLMVLHERKNEMETFCNPVYSRFGLRSAPFPGGLRSDLGIRHDECPEHCHVSFYMLGAYLSYTMLKVVSNFWLALIVCPILVALLGILMERLILRRVHAAGHVQEFVITFGILFALNEMIKWIWGSENLSVPIPSTLSGSLLIMGTSTPPIVSSFSSSHS